MVDRHQPDKAAAMFKALADPACLRRLTATEWNPMVSGSPRDCAKDIPQTHPPQPSHC